MPKPTVGYSANGRRRRRRKEKMKGHCSTCQSPQWAIVPIVEEEEEGRKNGRTLFDRPKPTVGYSANGRRRRRRKEKMEGHCSTCQSSQWAIVPMVEEEEEEEKERKKWKDFVRHTKAHSGL